MKWLIIPFVCLGVAAQDIDFSLAYAVANPTYTTATGVTSQLVTYTPSAIFDAALPQITAVDPTSNSTDGTYDTASTDKVKRSGCAVQPLGYGLVPIPDTPSTFEAFAPFALAADTAPTPSGYSQTFSNLHASNNAYGYLGYTTLKWYDVNGCAAQCNQINGCLSINIYFERDPILDPGTGCPNPPATTNIKCVFWGGPVNAANANNVGQYRDQFEVVIAGSNGYVNKTIMPLPGYSTAVDLGNAAINAPLDSLGANTYLGSAIFNSGPFNASLCAQACSAKSAYAIAHPPSDGSPPQTCQFFNTYILYINTTADLQGQYCAMYSETWSSSYATNVGQYDGSNHFLIEYSYAYSNASNPGAPNTAIAVDQASQAIAYSTLQPFCSTLLGYTANVVTTTSTVAPQNAKRTATAVSTPAGLTQYPSSIVTSACQLAVTSPAPTTTTTFTTLTTTTPTTSV